MSQLCQWCRSFPCLFNCPNRHPSQPYQFWNPSHNLLVPSTSSSSIMMFRPSRCQWCGFFPCLSNCPSRYQGANLNGQQQHTNQYPSPSREPSWGPTRHGRNYQPGFTQAETLHSNHFIHASSATIPGDGYTGVVPGIARNDANYNTGGSSCQV